MSDFDTNIERVQVMIYSTCGCSLKEGREVLKECLKRNTALTIGEQLGRGGVKWKKEIN